MEVQETNIPDVLVFLPSIYEDDRGFFVEVYRKDIFNDFCKESLNLFKQFSLVFLSTRNPIFEYFLSRIQCPNQRRRFF